MPLDLQIHSTFSDGVDSVENLAEMAKQNNLSLVSLTDHDNIHGVSRFLELCREQNIQAISGCEITADFHGKVVHLLGYKISTDNAELNAHLDTLLQQRKDGFMSVIPKLNAMLQAQGAGKLVDADDAQKAMGEYWGTPVFADYLVSRGFMPTKAQAVDYLIEQKGKVGKIEISQAIKMIHNAGGKAVLSHPFAHGISLYSVIGVQPGTEAAATDEAQQKIDALVSELKNMGMDGLECFQSSHYSAQDNMRAAQLAEKYNLGITAGSDWHGSLDIIDHQILRVMPRYAKHIGDIEIPVEYEQKIINFIKT